MTDATALTRAGDLRGAMAAIQQALNPGVSDAPAPPVVESEVIDVEARVIERDAPRVEPRRTGDDAAQFIDGHFAHRAGARDYKLFIPALRADKPRSLIVMLHGCTQNPDDFARGTRMNTLAAEENALVLYPAQSRPANAQGCWNWFKHNHQARNRGEPAILADMARHIASSHGVDPARIYVTGLSAGGAMAAILAETYPDVFAAAGVHSGLPAGAARDLPGALAAMKGQAAHSPGSAKKSAVRLIVFHGDADTTVDAVNGDRVAQAHGATAVGVDEERNLRIGSRTTTRRLHKDAQGRVVVEQWVVHGAGHAWFGGDPTGSYADARGPDASAEMLRFFLRG